MKALIPAAGLGTRFLPATKAQPKEMLLVVDRPAIQYVVEEGLASAADEVVIINSREKKAIEEHFSPNPQLVATLRARGKDKYADLVEQVGSYNVSYVYQDEALGLGHAVRCAAEKTGDEPFYVLLGDVLVPDNTMLPRMQEVSRRARRRERDRRDAGAGRPGEPLRRDRRRGGGRRRVEGGRAGGEAGA